jgi:plastocyanin
LPGRSTCLALTAGAAALAFAFPVAAQAKVKTVTEGLPISDQAKFLQTAYEADAIDYFPHTVTIHVGDSVKFAPTAFHNIDIPALKHGKQQGPLPLLVPSTFVTGDNDAAGNPFWFNNQRPNVGFNAALLPPNFSVDYSPTKVPGHKVVKATYTGKKAVTSTIPFNAGPPSTQVKFTRAGTYTVYCDLHLGMKGVVRVLSKKKKVPSAKADAAAIKRQVARDFKVAKTLKQVPVPANTVDVGSAGKYGVEYFGYLPKTLTVPAHTTVTFRITDPSFEDHTATTAAAQNIDPEDTAQKSHLGTIAASFFSTQFNPEGVWPSDQNEPASLTLASHGDGFWNSGVLAPPARNPFPALITNKRSVTFDQPGTYDFYCMVHPQMHGTVVVTG